MKAITQYALTFERGEKDVVMEAGIEVEVQQIDHVFYKVTNSAGEIATVTEHAFRYKEKV